MSDTWREVNQWREDVDEPSIVALHNRAVDWLRQFFDREVRGEPATTFEAAAEPILRALLLVLDYSAPLEAAVHVINATALEPEKFYLFEVDRTKLSEKQSLYMGAYLKKWGIRGTIVRSIGGDAVRVVEEEKSRLTLADESELTEPPAITEQEPERG